VRSTRKSIASATTTTATNAAQSPGVPIVCIDRPKKQKPREPVGRTGPDVSSGRTFAVTGEGLARKPLDWLAHRTGALRLVLTISAAGATPLLRAQNSGAGPDSQ
jgi:hypothetical protein